MKKIISILLIACMCISLCMGFTSCNMDKTDDQSVTTQGDKEENKSENITTNSTNNIPEEDITEEDTTKENVSETTEDK